MSSTATLVIDMQVDFFSHERLALHRQALVTKFNRLTGETRAAGLPVIWVRQEFAPDLSDATLEVKRNKIEVVIAGTLGASLLPELNVQEIDYVVVKKRYSGFFGTDLDQILSDLGCVRLIIAGVNTHACVRATVVDAYQRDYDLILASDCIDSHDVEHHEVTWRYLDGKLGQAMANEQIFSLLAARD